MTNDEAHKLAFDLFVGKSGMVDEPGMIDLAAALIRRLQAERDEAKARIAALEKALASAKETLDMIAGQHLKDEGDYETVDDGDYEGTYDEIVRLARTAARVLKKDPDAETPG